MRQRVLLLSATRYSMADERNPGRRVEGISAYYVALEQRPADTPDSLGVQPIKATIPLTQWPVLDGQKLPAVCELTMGLSTAKKTGGQLTQTLVPEYVTYVCPVDLSALGNVANAAPGVQVKPALAEAFGKGANGSGAVSQATAGVGR